MIGNMDSLADFDWVSLRAKCTRFKIFETLRSHVQNDINRRNLLTGADVKGRKTFLFDHNGNWFSVTYKVYGIHKGVMFILNQNGVEVQDIEPRTTIHEGILVMSDDGQCRLRVGQIEYDLWQFRKLALQDLFFVNQEIAP